jgi:proteic killer suppression protein
MIKSFAHKGLEAFFVSGSVKGINPQHAGRVRRQLARLDVATAPQDMNVPGWKFHELKGVRKGEYAVWINGNWRLTFRFEGTDAVKVNCEDYH